jgi:hypothetical protein
MRFDGYHRERDYYRTGRGCMRQQLDNKRNVSGRQG